MSHRKILEICPSWVGDLVMATPAFRAVRRSFPDAETTALIRPYGLGVLAGGPWFDRTVVFDRRKAGIPESFKTVLKLRAERFDLAVVYPNSFSAATIAWLSGARERVGYRRDRRSALLTRSIPRPGEGPGEGGVFTPLYMADYYLALAAAAGAAPAGRELELHVLEAEDSAAAALLSAHGLGPGERLIGLNPGAAFGSSKCWLPERFAKAGDLLAGAFQARCLILAGPGEAEIQRRIAEQMTSNPLAPPPGEQPLPVLKALVKRLALLLTNDTGPRHFAAAFRVPAVVLMGPTDPRYTFDPGEKAEVLRAEVPCGPCHLKTCPKDHACMKALTPEAVLEAARKLLSATGGA